jgi:hypothetical protein
MSEQLGPAKTGVPLPPGNRRTWRVSPPDLMSFISAENRKTALALFDFEPDELENGKLRVDLRAAIKPIEVRHKEAFALTEADYYIGCTSASIEIEFDSDLVESHSTGAAFKVAYKHSETRKRSSTTKIEPSVELSSAIGDVTVSAGSSSYEAGNESVFETSFAYEERDLAAVAAGKSVKWRFDPPSGDKAVRSFLFCNLHLFAICGAAQGRQNGAMSIKPSDISVFGPDRRSFAKTKSILLLFALYRAKRRIFRPRGITVRFEEVLA